MKRSGIRDHAADSFESDVLRAIQRCFPGSAGASSGQPFFVIRLGELRRVKTPVLTYLFSFTPQRQDSTGRVAAIP